MIRVLFIVFDELFYIYSYQLDDYSGVTNLILKNYQYNFPLFYGIPFSEGVKAYSLFVGFFYYLFENHEIIMRLINAFLAVLMTARVYQISLQIFSDKRQALLACVLTSFYPSIILFSCLNLRDPIVLFLSYEMIYQFFKAHQLKFMTVRTALIFVLYCIIGQIRPQNFYLFALIFFIYFSVIFLKRKGYKNFKITLIIISVGILIFLGIIFQDILNFFIEYPLQTMQKRVGGGSAYLVWMKYTTVFDIFLYAPIRFIYFTFGPLIWDVRGASMLISFFESLGIIAIFYWAIKYFYKKRSQSCLNFQIFLFIFGLIGLIANAIVDSNYGTAIRHRIVYIIPFIIFASAYLVNFQHNFKRKILMFIK
jgi:4-amino-4-deoxy-L-arabinose transferase-like glycosyltransferase